MVSNYWIIYQLVDDSLCYLLLLIHINPPTLTMMINSDMDKRLRTAITIRQKGRLRRPCDGTKSTKFDLSTEIDPSKSKKLSLTRQG